MVGKTHILPRNRRNWTISAVLGFRPLMPIARISEPQAFSRQRLIPHDLQLLLNSRPYTERLTSNRQGQIPVRSRCARRLRVTATSVDDRSRWAQSVAPNEAKPRQDRQDRQDRLSMVIRSSGDPRPVRHGRVGRALESWHTADTAVAHGRWWAFPPAAGLKERSVLA